MMQHLKKIRLAVGLAIFFILGLAFLGIESITPSQKVYGLLTHVQLIPALLMAMDAIGIALIVVVVLFVLTYFFGRFYCSTICPLGTFQDVFSRIGKKFRRKKIYRYKKSNNILRYSVLAISFLLLVFHSILLLNFLDPYSNFGKIVSDLFRPMAIFANDSLAGFLENFGLYWVNPVGLRKFSLLVILFPLTFFAVVFIMSFFRGRLFCNTLCPAGTLLSIVSRYSFFKIKINETDCTRCGKCSMVCKAECIDVKERMLDFSRCISCYNCLEVCKEKAIKFKPVKVGSIQNKELKFAENKGRREFFTSIGLIAGTASAFAWGSKKKSSGKNAVQYEKQNPVCPPGSHSIHHFNMNCTACHLCVSACPTQVLQPSLTKYGLAGFLQPHMDFETSFCNYECTHCSEVCPTGAILPIKRENKILTQIGKVVFVKENCVVFTDETSCGACSEHCPTKAVAMVPYKGMLTIPHTNEAICVGCGACEYACPVRPLRAIYVEGNPLHLTAQKPEETKAEEGKMEEFPF